VDVSPCLVPSDPFSPVAPALDKEAGGPGRITLAQGAGKTNSLCFQVDTTETTYYILFWLQSLFPEQGIHETEIILRSRFLWPPL
jgi:hypothetical protein